MLGFQVVFELGNLVLKDGPLVREMPFNLFNLDFFQPQLLSQPSVNVLDLAHSLIEIHFPHGVLETRRASTGVCYALQLGKHFPQVLIQDAALVP